MSLMNRTEINIWSKIMENRVSIIISIFIAVIVSIFQSDLQKFRKSEFILYILGFFLVTFIIFLLIKGIILLIRWLKSWLQRKILKLIDLDSKLNRGLVLSHYIHFHERAADEGGLKDKMETLESPSSFPDLEKAIDKIIEISVCGEEYAKEFVRDAFIILVGRLPRKDELKEAFESYLKNCNLNARRKDKTYNAKIAVINFIREQIIPDGTLIRRESEDPVYLVQRGEIRLFPDKETLLALGYKFKDVRKILSEEINKMPKGKNIESVKTATKIKHQNTGEVYLILNGKKHWVPDPNILITFFDNNNSIKNTSAEEIRKYPKGRELVSELGYNTKGKVTSMDEVLTNLMLMDKK